MMKSFDDNSGGRQVTIPTPMSGLPSALRGLLIWSSHNVLSCPCPSHPAANIPSLTFFSCLIFRFDFFYLRSWINPYLTRITVCSGWWLWSSSSLVREDVGGRNHARRRPGACPSNKPVIVTYQFEWTHSRQPALTQAQSSHVTGFPVCRFACEEKTSFELTLQHPIQIVTKWGNISFILHAHVLTDLGFVTLTEGYIIY